MDALQSGAIFRFKHANMVRNTMLSARQTSSDTSTQEKPAGSGPTPLTALLPSLALSLEHNVTFSALQRAALIRSKFDEVHKLTSEVAGLVGRGSPGSSNFGRNYGVRYTNSARRSYDGTIGSSIRTYASPQSSAIRRHSSSPRDLERMHSSHDHIRNLGSSPIDNRNRSSIVDGSHRNRVELLSPSQLPGVQSKIRLSRGAILGSDTRDSLTGLSRSGRDKNRIAESVSGIDSFAVADQNVQINAQSQVLSPDGVSAEMHISQSGRIIAKSSRLADLPRDGPQLSSPQSAALTSRKRKLSAVQPSLTLLPLDETRRLSRSGSDGSTGSDYEYDNNDSLSDIESSVKVNPKPSSGPNGKRGRGRPRKNQAPSGDSQEAQTGQTFENVPSEQEGPIKRGRGRPPGSGKKQSVAVAPASPKKVGTVQQKLAEGANFGSPLWTPQEFMALYSAHATESAAVVQGVDAVTQDHGFWERVSDRIRTSAIGANFLHSAAQCEARWAQAIAETEKRKQKLLARTSSLANSHAGGSTAAAAAVTVADEQTLVNSMLLLN